MGPFSFTNDTHRNCTVSAISTASCTPVDHKISLIIGQEVVYVLLGLWSICANMLVVAAVASNRKLHQKYIYAAALSSSDFLSGLGYFLAGCMRLNIVASTNDDTFINVTAVDCISRPFNWFILIGMQVSALFSVSIAADRLVAIAFPVWYFLQQPVNRIHLITAVAVYTAGLISFSFALVASVFDSGESYTNLCITEFAVGEVYSMFHYGVSASLGIVAVCLYAATILTFKLDEKRYKMPPGTLTMWRLRNLPATSVAVIGLKRQRRFTRTMGVVVALMIIWFIIPTSGDFVLVLLKRMKRLHVVDFETLSPWFGIMFCINTCLTPIVYGIFNRELRQSFAQTLRSLRILPRAREMANAEERKDSRYSYNSASLTFDRARLGPIADPSNSAMKL